MFQYCTETFNSNHTCFTVRLQVEYERLGSPYGECIDVPDPNIPYYYDRKYYSVDACYRSCSQNSLIQKCGCGDPRASIPEGVDYCPVEKSTFTKSKIIFDSKISKEIQYFLSILRFLEDCVDNFFDQYDSNVTCHCPLKCRHVHVISFPTMKLL